MHILKHLFLGITLLSAVELTAATETLSKQDFESVINKGLSDFMDQFGREKKAELGIEDLVQKQKLEEEKEPKESESEKELRELKQQLEDVEKERQKKKERKEEAKKEEVELLGSRIDEAIQKIKVLQNYQLSYGELSKFFRAMDEYYMENKEQALEMATFRELKCREAYPNDDFAQLVDKHRYACNQPCSHLIRPNYTRQVPLAYLPMMELMKKHIQEMMEKYSRLSSTPHSHYQEFSNRELSKG